MEKYNAATEQMLLFNPDLTPLFRSTESVGELVSQKANTDAMVALEKRQELQKIKTQKLKERYTKYCLEYLSGYHLKKMLFSRFIPVIDKIDPLYQTTLSENSTPKNFFNILLNTERYAAAILYLDLPQIKPYLQTDKEALLNLKESRQYLRSKLLAGAGKDAEFDKALPVLTAQISAKTLFPALLFTQENPSLTHKEVITGETVYRNRFNLSVEKKVDLGKQSVLSFLITQGFFDVALQYMSELPENTTLSDLSSLFNTPSALQTLKEIAHQNPGTDTSAGRFLQTLEKTMPTDLYMEYAKQHTMGYHYSKDFDQPQRESSETLPWIKQLPHASLQNVSEPEEERSFLAHQGFRKHLSLSLKKEDNSL